MLLHGIIGIFQMIGNLVTDLCGFILTVSLLTDCLIGPNQSAKRVKNSQSFEITMDSNLFSEWSNQKFVLTNQTRTWFFHFQCSCELIDCLLEAYRGRAQCVIKLVQFRSRLCPPSFVKDVLQNNALSSWPDFPQSVARSFVFKIKLIELICHWKYFSKIAPKKHASDIGTQYLWCFFFIEWIIYIQKNVFVYLCPRKHF